VTLLHSAQSLLAGLIALARTRVELFSTELQEELTRLFFTMIGAVAVLLLAALGAGFAAYALVLSVEPALRALAAALVAVGFFALAMAAAWTMRRLTMDKRRAFSATLGELDRDREAVQP
jgi:uncharacterized membrane protein YqjE